MAEHAGQALWELYGLLHALKAKSGSPQESNAIFDGIKNLEMIGTLITVPPPSEQALTQLMPRFTPVSVPPPAQASSGPSNYGRKMSSDGSEALSLCQQIIDDVPNLPQEAFDFGASIDEKAKSMMASIQKFGSATPKQLEALRNMRMGQEKWLQGNYD